MNSDAAAGTEKVTGVLHAAPLPDIAVNGRTGSFSRTGSGSLGRRGNPLSPPGPTLSPESVGTSSPADPDKRQLLRLSSLSGFQLFDRVASSKDEISKEVLSPKPFTLKDGVTLPVVGQLRWSQIRSMAWQWLKSPLNLALLLWIIGVTISGAILFMIMVGMLDSAIPKKSDRDEWFEVCNQVINGLFTLMCVLMHPLRIRYAVRLYEWTPKDVLIMRTAFCKGGGRKPSEWKHMFVVVALLNGNCIFQYCLAGFNWGYPRDTRPALAVGVFLALALGCAAAAGLYNVLSPLGKDYSLRADTPEFSQRLSTAQGASDLLPKALSFARDQQPVADAQWQGEVLLDCCTNWRTAVLTSFCCLCAHGINLERLGFGNKYVHVVTFAFFLVAPFLIFCLAAVNINNETVRHAVGGAGIALSLLGVLYGGYWRMMMRQVYNLPKYRWCFGSASVTDLATWLFCPCCATCQEIRTAEHYDVADSLFFVKGHGTGQPRRSDEYPLETIKSLGLAEENRQENGMKAPVPAMMRVTEFEDVDLEQGAGSGHSGKSTKS